MKPALGLTPLYPQLTPNMTRFGFGFASAEAQVQLQREIDRMRSNVPQWVVERAPVNQPEEEIKVSHQESIATGPGRAINLSQPSQQSDDSSVLELDVEELSDGGADETSALLSELQNNPNPLVQQAILVDFEIRRDVANQLIEQGAMIQGNDNQDRRESILDFVMRIPTERMQRIFETGSRGVTFLSQFYALWVVSRRNKIIHDDIGGIKNVYDTSYDTYVPVEKILDKPVPAHCKRVLFTDEFGRTRSKLICGNVQDSIGQRVYYNN